jgi:hypothetical protein
LLWIWNKIQVFLATDVEDSREENKIGKSYLRKKVSSDAAMNDFRALGAAFNPSVRNPALEIIYLFFSFVTVGFPGSEPRPWFGIHNTDFF